MRQAFDYSQTSRPSSPSSLFVLCIHELLLFGLSSWWTLIKTIDLSRPCSGLFGCAFTLGRTLGFRPWRSLRRRRGERTALVASLILSAAFSLLFGAAPSFPAAVLARLLLGLSNGVSGAVKRAAVDAARAENRRRSAYMVDHTRDAELVLEEHEAAATESVLSVMAWGMAAGPWAGGVLCSDPRGGRYGSGSEHDASGGYPFLGPNLLAAGLCLVLPCRSWWWCAIVRRRSVAAKT